MAVWVRSQIKAILAFAQRIVSWRASRGAEVAADEEETRAYPWEKSYPKELDWRTTFEPEPLTAILDRAIEAYPESIGIDFLGKRYRYKDIGSLVAKAARGFQAIGVGKGVRVGLLLPNCPYYVICFFAVLRAGGTVVNFNPLSAEREIERQVRDSGARIMVTLNLKGIYPKVADQLADGALDRIVVCSMSGILRLPDRALFAFLRRKELAAVRADGRHIRFEALVAEGNGTPAAPADIDPARDVAVLQYTGGTTGTPKGAALTHANLSANAHQVRMWAIGARPGEEKVLGVVPLFHAFGMTGVMIAGIGLGAELILLPRFKLQDVLKVIDRQRPTVFIGVPTMYAAINGCGDLGRYDLSSLTFCISGGAPLPATVQQSFETLTGCTLVEGYGLTEAGPVCTINPFQGVNKSSSVGLPLPGTVIEIRDLRTPERRLPVGEAGEICVAGPQVMSGYWDHPEESAAVLRGGRLFTGDVGYIDEDGYLYIIDRIKDLILSGGFNVYPRMVEEAVHLHPAIEEVAVCGVPNSFRGEVVKAYVKLRPGEELTAKALRAFLQDKLTPYEIPRAVEFRDELPKTLIGKVARRELVAEELERRKRAGIGPRDAVTPG